jgi:hypothetical protein
MNDIKKKKQEVVAKMKPVWDEKYRLDREADKEMWGRYKKRMKCFWSYPWGHIYGPWEGPKYFQHHQCMVCRHDEYLNKHGLS